MLEQKDILYAYKIIGANVARIRKQKKYSQLKLSLAMGHNSVSLVSFSEICLKGAHFNIEHLLQISMILEVNVMDFFAGVDEFLLNLKEKNEIEENDSG